MPAARTSAAKRKLSRPARLPAQRGLSLGTAGEFFDLRAVFDRLHLRYFRHSEALAGYTITWGRRRRLPPREYFVFGSIQEDDRIIRIHPGLDVPWVPEWFLEYVVYHEMLHAIVPDELLPGGRRRVHTLEFHRRERLFAQYRRARRWEDENLLRFLR